MSEVVYNNEYIQYDWIDRGSDYPLAFKFLDGQYAGIMVEYSELFITEDEEDSEADPILRFNFDIIVEGYEHLKNDDHFLDQVALLLRQIVIEASNAGGKIGRNRETSTEESGPE